MSNTIKIYLAGQMSNLTYDQMNSWRVELKHMLLKSAEMSGVKIKVINPVDYYNFQNPRHKTEREVMDYDLNHVKSSDIVIVNLYGLNDSRGTGHEIYEAFRSGIPVLAFGNIYEYKNVHPWDKECITRVDWTKEELIEYITDFYFT